MLLLTLTLGAFLPVTSFADDGIATNDTVLTQPKTDTDINTSEAPQSPEVPSVNVNGQIIISTQNSQLVVANNDGTTSLVAPEVQDSK